MKCELHVQFEGREISMIEAAFGPVARLRDYPDLMAALVVDGISDFPHALRVAHSLGAPNSAHSAAQIGRGEAILGALLRALRQDLGVDYSPAPAAVVEPLLSARRAQIGAVERARPLLQRAHRYAGGSCTWPA